MLGSNRQKKVDGLVIQPTCVSKAMYLIAGIDAGSTETRVCLADEHDHGIYGSDDVKQSLDTIMTTYRIPSTYANAEDAREIPPVSEFLEDNYDSTIVLIKTAAERPLLSKHRVLRGRKTQDAMGLVYRYLDSSTNKTDNVIFYTNIIDGLGYAIMQKYNGQIPNEVHVFLTLSVRPKEMNTICRNKMTENLVGSFLFCWKNVNIRLYIDGLDFTTEPEAEITGTMTVYDLRAASDSSTDKYSKMADRFNDADCSVHIEGGGSSIGVEVMRNGNILDACSSTFALGGNYMAQLFIDRYRELNGRTVTKEAANNALITCTLREGRNTLDVTDLVAQCKNQVGMDILERFRHEVIDTMSDLTMQDIEFISLGGRLFRADPSGNTIGTYFEEYVHQLSPNTDVIILPENFIAQGNLVIGLNSDFAANITHKAEDEATQEDGKEEKAASVVPMSLMVSAPSKEVI